MADDYGDRGTFLDVDNPGEDTMVFVMPHEADPDATPPPMLHSKKQTAPFDRQGFASVEELIGRPRSDGFPTGDFRLVPARLADLAYEAGIHRWWIELWPDMVGSEPIRLEIVGDIIIGRSSLADVDLQEYRASEYGVSRQHIMLRPSRKSLYLLDLGSTNGTHFNGIPMGQGIALPVTENGVIRLGTMNLTVRFLASTTT